MLKADLLQIAIYILAILLLSPALGSYMAKIFMGQYNFLNPIENFIYKISAINKDEEMDAKKYSCSLLLFSLFGFLALFLLQIFQKNLPLNPNNIGPVEIGLAINTAISFVTNTNWQAYSGEDTLSYLTQSLGLTVQNFLSASTGIAVLLGFIRGLTQKNTRSIGNFWQDLTRTTLYILLPLAILWAILLVSLGVVQNISPYEKARTLEGQEQIIPGGPAASQIAIKQLGSNGGGFFGLNSAHPFENPNPSSNFLEMLALLLLPASLVHMFGLMTGRRRHAWMIFGVMMALFIGFFIISWWSESLGTYNLEGKELRFGVMNSVLYANATTASSNGSVNAMHDSLSPLAGGIALCQIILGEIIFGGVGSGLYGMLLFILLTMFISGLMIGRTPEYLGKKIEAKEILLVLIAILSPSAMILLGAGISAIWPLALDSILNQGPHGLTEILYAWGSTANNNGSAFMGLNANNNFFNYGLSLSMLVGRFLVIIPVLMIAENFAYKKPLSQSSGSMPIDSPLFALLLIGVIILVGALTFVPALVLGPVVEHFLWMAGQTF